MQVLYTRRFQYGDKGTDVEGVARALCRAKVGIPIAVFNALPVRIRRTWGGRKPRRACPRHPYTASASTGRSPPTSTPRHGS
jgi:hypothetical protein